MQQNQSQLYFLLISNGIVNFGCPQYLFLQVLAQKYGYELPKIENDPKYEMFNETKDPRQIFYGLEPGWVVNLADRAIIKATSGYHKPTQQQQKVNAAAA